MGRRIRGEDRITHHSLPFGGGMHFAINHTLGTITVLTVRDGKPLVIGETQLAESELLLFLVLLDNHPSYSPYEHLYAVFTWGNANEQNINAARQVIHTAIEESNLEMLMRPLRNLISRLRLHVKAIGINVASVSETGYMLLPS